MAEQYSVDRSHEPFCGRAENFGAGRLCRDEHRPILSSGFDRSGRDLRAASPDQALWRSTGLAQRSADRLIREKHSIAAGLKALLPDDGIERFAVAFFRSGLFLTSRVLAEGTLAVVMLKTRKIVHAALDFDADQIVIGHNHPSGNVMPSRHDFEATQQLRSVTESVGIELLDHKIFAYDYVFSMKKGIARCIGVK